MSGQLVGEVIAAAPALKARGLTERGFMALIAIAEKCHTATRQASVPWFWIQSGLFGASLSTAKRAIRDLKDAGVVRVVKRGFDNHHGRSCAPIYEILPLSERVTQVTHSVDSERVTQVTHSQGGERVTSGGRTGQIGGRTGHLGDLLNGSINGSTNGTTKESGAKNAPPTPTVEPSVSPIPAKKPARKRNPKTPMPEDFTAPESEITKILDRFPAATRAAIDRETFLFVNHFLGTGETRPGWLASWRKWMANADKRGDFTTARNNGNGASGHHQKIADVDAAADRALELLGYTPDNSPAITGTTPKEIS